MEKNIIDKENMREVIIESAKQLNTGLLLAKNIQIKAGVSNIIICGMGGSALPAEVLNTVVTPTIPITIHRDYHLPTQANKQSCIICISYSGNTEETLSILKEAIEKNLSIIGISSGGKMEKMCGEKNIPFVKIPGGIQPRCAIGYMFSALAKILINSVIINDISGEILQTSQKLKATHLQLEKEGKVLAKKLLKKIPIIYASNNLKEIAHIWKIKFNENSKIPAFYNYFPELNHNEMVGYTGLKKSGIKNFYTIILQDSSDHPRIQKRMALTAELIKKNGAKVEVLSLPEDSLLFKTFSTLMLGDWISYHLALLQKIDPTPVTMVEDFKMLLKK